MDAKCVCWLKKQLSKIMEEDINKELFQVSGLGPKGFRINRNTYFLALFPEHKWLPTLSTFAG